MVQLPQAISVENRTFPIEAPNLTNFPKKQTSHDCQLVEYFLKGKSLLRNQKSLRRPTKYDLEELNTGYYPHANVIIYWMHYLKNFKAITETATASQVFPFQSMHAELWRLTEEFFPNYFVGTYTILSILFTIGILNDCILFLLGY